MAIAAAYHIGVTPNIASEALNEFINTKRRLELKGEVNGIKVYDDFAHHPTAIRLTLEALRNKESANKVIAVIEPRSATMKRGVHKETLADSLKEADSIYIYQPDNLSWSVTEITDQCSQPTYASDDIEQMIKELSKEAKTGDSIVIMSNGGFEDIHNRLLIALQNR